MIAYALNQLVNLTQERRNLPIGITIVNEEHERKDIENTANRLES
jgi:hypothetical protein